MDQSTKDILLLQVIARMEGENHPDRIQSLHDLLNRYKDLITIEEPDA